MSEPIPPITRTPATVGSLPWILHRLSAVALIVLLALHLGVQLYARYGFAAVYQWGIYGALLDVTLGLVLLHGFLGVRATIIELSTSHRTKTVLVWIAGSVGIALLVYRILG